MILVRKATPTALLYGRGRRGLILETGFCASDDELAVRPVLDEHARNSGNWWEPERRLVLSGVKGLERVSNVSAFGRVEHGKNLFASVPPGIYVRKN